MGVPAREGKKCLLAMVTLIVAGNCIACLNSVILQGIAAAKNTNEGAQTC